MLSSIYARLAPLKSAFQILIRGAALKTLRRFAAKAAVES
jgi:hypothetical protein